MVPQERLLSCLPTRLKHLLDTLSTAASFWTLQSQAGGLVVDDSSVGRRRCRRKPWLCRGGLPIPISRPPSSSASQHLKLKSSTRQDLWPVVAIFHFSDSYLLSLLTLTAQVVWADVGDHTELSIDLRRSFGSPKIKFYWLPNFR